MNKGELQDLSASAKGYMHYALEHFKESVKAMVELGRRIKTIDKRKAIAELTEDTVEIALVSCDEFADCESFTDQQWVGLYDESLKAMNDWLEVILKKKNQEKAKRRLSKLTKALQCYSCIQAKQFIQMAKSER